MAVNVQQQLESEARPVEPTYDEPLEACLLCGSGALRPFDRDYRGHRIVQCQTCKIRFMNPQYTDVWLRHYYSQYVSPDGDSNEERWRSMAAVRRAGKTRGLSLLGRYVDRGRLLVVGCGDGLELRIAKELGWQVEGVDVDHETTRRVAQNEQVEVHCGQLVDLSFEAGSFDAVFLDQVIEHPKNPGEVLRKVHELLRPRGVVYLGQPNIGSLSNSVKTLMGRLGLRRRRRGKHYSTQHHITYFRPRVFKRLLEAHFGFEVLQMTGSPKPARWGWFRPLLRRLPFLDSSFALIARRL
ncbi:MAG: class I SAM-dependent methyltransferase [Planctomycetota bacterium]|nr:class I SAM-dependent methyltransferase [Planctomycetota bacterium]